VKCLTEFELPSPTLLPLSLFASCLIENVKRID